MTSRESLARWERPLRRSPALTKARAHSPDHFYGRRLDIDTIWNWLSTEAYWGRSRTRPVLERQISRAWRCVAVYSTSTSTSTSPSALVGFTRIVSDGEAFGYLADVFVLKSHSGKGLGKAMVGEAVNGEGGEGWKWLLGTRDAQGLYKPFGFAGADESVNEILQRGF